MAAAAARGVPATPLFRQLRPRRNGPSRAVVASNQRGRIIGGFTASVLADGFDATSVEGICRLAGVSKRAFYEHFANKQECEEVAVEEALAPVLELAIPGVDLRTSLTALARLAAEHPEAARMLLADHDGDARRPTAAPHARGGLVVVLSRALPLVAGCGALVRALACGLEAAARRQAFGEAGARLEDDIDDLSAWLACYRRPVGLPEPLHMHALRGMAPAPALAGREAGSRRRLMLAAVELMGERGEEQSCATSIAERAALGIEVFEESFAGAQKCIGDAVELACAEAAMAIAEAAGAPGPSDLRVARAVAALMRHVQASPLARAVARASAGAGPRARLLERELATALRPLFLAPWGQSKPPPEVVIESIEAGLVMLVQEMAGAVQPRAARQATIAAVELVRSPARAFGAQTVPARGHGATSGLASPRPVSHF